jgi:5-methylcytosine-specific restriction protein A
LKRYEEFKRYLESNWSKTTAYKYSRAIYTISNELFNYNLLECDIYIIDDIDIINNLLGMYLSVPEFEQKDIRGNRMYSNAIKRYVDFYNNINNVYEIGENIENYDSENHDKPKTKPNTIATTTIERIKRDSVVSGNAIIKANHHCEYDVNHCFFISKATGDNYVEAHHLIPMKAHNDFSNSLDVEANVISLCVICHKVLHHGKLEDKVDIIKKLYNDRAERLKSCNIGITLDRLLDYYK